MFPLNTKILIVDDSVVMRTLITAALKKIGFNNFFEATGGVQAFKKIEAARATGDPYRLILSDQNMPEGTGLELLVKLRSKPEYQDLPFIVVTSENEKGVIMELINEGANSYITKPFSAEDMMARIKSTYSRSKAPKKK